MIFSENRYPLFRIMLESHRSQLFRDTRLRVDPEPRNSGFEVSPRPGMIFNPDDGSCGAALLRGKLPQGFLCQDGIAIFPDFLDLAALEPEHQAIVVVVTLACRGEIVTLRLDHDVVAVRNETMRDRSRPPDQERADMAEQIVEDRVLAGEGARP